MANLPPALRKLLGIFGIGLSWGIVWAALFAVFFLLIGILRPQDLDEGEGPLGASSIGFVIGFVSGTIFGLFLSIAENRKSIHDLALIRVAIWGVLGSAAWPLLTPLPKGMMIILCPLGAICASVAIAMVRRAELHGPKRSRLRRWIGRLLETSLRAACASSE